LNATARGDSASDITTFTLDPRKNQSPPQSNRKRPAKHGHVRRGEGSYVEVVDPMSDYDRGVPQTVMPARSRKLFDHNQAATGRSSPQPSTTKLSDRSREATKSGLFQSSQPLSRTTPQPGLIELQRYDPGYPELFMQPDSRPISHEQLVSEVKSIYKRLTIIETKCRAQTAAAQNSSDSNRKLAPDWQALIALHRTLLPPRCPGYCHLLPRRSEPVAMSSHQRK
jgi:hypothetical protein